MKNFKGLVQEWKLNSRKDVQVANKHLIFPQIGASKANNSQNVKTFNLSPTDRQKLDRLRAKYRISRSAIVRILLSQVDEFESEDTNE